METPGSIARRRSNTATVKPSLTQVLQGSLAAAWNVRSRIRNGAARNNDARIGFRGCPEMHQFGADIRRGNQNIRPNLSLNAQVPLLGVGRLHVQAAILKRSSFCERKILVLDNR